MYSSIFPYDAKNNSRNYERNLFEASNIGQTILKGNNGRVDFRSFESGNKTSVQKLIKVL